MIEYLIQYVGDYKTVSLELRRINAAVVIGAVFLLDDFVADDWSVIAELPQKYNRWRVTEMHIDGNGAKLIVTPIVEVTG
jgi:hypothetical protein